MPSPKTLATGQQFPEGPVVDKDGSILIVEIERRTITRVKDGKTDIVAKLPGGPNGLAWGPDGSLYVCNNGGFLFTKAADGGNRVKPGVPDDYTGGWIERVDLKTGERHVLALRGERANRATLVSHDRSPGLASHDSKTAALAPQGLNRSLQFDAYGAQDARRDRHGDGHRRPRCRSVDPSRLRR